MRLFTRKPESLIPYTDAPAYAANGFATLPVERHHAEAGPHWAMPAAYEAPHGGNSAWGLPAPVDPEKWVVSIQAGVLPREGGRGAAEAKATWVPLVRIAAAGKRAARDIRAVVGNAPLVRLDLFSGDVLVVYRAADDVTDPRAFDFRQGRVTCNCSGAFLVSSPRHLWLDERSPANTRRDELPPLTWTAARDLVATIDSMLSKAAA